VTVEAGIDWTKQPPAEARKRKKPPPVKADSLPTLQARRLAAAKRDVKPGHPKEAEPADLWLGCTR
jgi:hypothetical protein